MGSLDDIATRKALMDMLRHECGHLITAKALGFTTGHIELQADRACAEIDLPLSMQSLDDVKAFLGRRVQVLYAGSIAQSLNPKGKANAPDTDKFLRSERYGRFLENPGVGAAVCRRSEFRRHRRRVQEEAESGGAIGPETC